MPPLCGCWQWNPSPLLGFISVLLNSETSPHSIIPNLILQEDLSSEIIMWLFPGTNLDHQFLMLVMIHSSIIILCILLFFLPTPFPQPCFLFLFLSSGSFVGFCPICSIFCLFYLWEGKINVWNRLCCLGEIRGLFISFQWSLPPFPSQHDQVLVLCWSLYQAG